MLALTKCLQKHVFDRAYLQKNRVAFASDGASVMLGGRNLVWQNEFQTCTPTSLSGTV